MKTTTTISAVVFLGGWCASVDGNPKDAQSEEPVVVCTKHLQVLGLALDAYQRDHGELPHQLSDLFPQYIADRDVIRCPTEASSGISQTSGSPVTLKLAYEMGTEVTQDFGLQLGPQRLGPGSTRRDVRIAQRVNFGERVPVVRCYQHGGLVLDLSPTGQVYRNQRAWEFDLSSVRAVLDCLKRDLRAGAEQFSKNWSLGAIEGYFTLWPNKGRVLLVDAALPAELRYHLGTVAIEFSTVAPSLTGSSEHDAYYLAARFHQAAGQIQAAIAASEKAVRIAGNDKSASGLLADLRWIASGKIGVPPIEEYLKAEMQRRRIPSLSVAVSRGGDVMLARGYGLANVERSVAATKDTVYEIASMTKTFTATGIMMLVEEGKVELDDPISKHIPATPVAWKDVVVRHLLSHTSGIVDWINDLPEEKRPDFNVPADFIRTMGQLPLKSPPGERWSYCNTGFLLLGWIIERVTGKPIEVFFDARIFRPLQMTSTAKSFTDLNILSAGYSRNLLNSDDVAHRRNPVKASGSGGFVSTVSDLVKWDAALNTEKLLKKSSMQQMWTSFRLNNGVTGAYGLGWAVSAFRGHWSVDHGGEGAGHSSQLFRFVDEGLTVIVLANLSGGSAIRVAMGIPRLYLTSPNPVEDMDPNVTESLRDVILRLAKGQVDATRFTAEAHAALVGQISDAAAFYKPLGPLKSFRLIEAKRDGGKRIFRYWMEFRDTRWIQVFVQTEEGRIMEIALEPE